MSNRENEPEKSESSPVRRPQSPSTRPSVRNSLKVQAALVSQNAFRTLKQAQQSPAT